MTDERYSFCIARSPLRTVPIYHIERAISRTSLGQGKKLSPEDDLDVAADEIIAGDLDEFCWSLHFEPAFLSRLFYSVCNCCPAKLILIGFSSHMRRPRSSRGSGLLLVTKASPGKMCLEPTRCCALYLEVHQTRVQIFHFD
jgi:hypothetical protein